MRKLTLILIALAALASCGRMVDKDPYKDSLCTLIVRASYGEEYSSYVRAGVVVKVEDVNLGTAYSALTDEAGIVSLEVPMGVYRVSVTDVRDEDIFNGTADKTILNSASMVVSVDMLHSRAGTIVIKEIYSGGCKRLPQEGNYQYDQYMILHNNSASVQYLDGLCVGSLFPYNSMASNPFSSRDPQTGETIYPDYVPICEVVWQFPGDGTKHPLQPGEDAVVCLKGAIDHSAQFPLSVNLNRPGYYVCYNNTYFTNTTNHPAPGTNIAPDHYLDVVVKTGIANAYTFSMNSPAAVLYRAQGMTMQEFIQSGQAVIPIPGNASKAQVTAIPTDWIVDAVEVFSGTSSSNAKRLQPSLDAGYVTLSDVYLGHTVHRYVNEVATAAMGYEVLVDTNNSSSDLYERETQSLHE